MDRFSRSFAGGARLRHGPDRAQPGYPADQRGPSANKRAAPVDLRHLRLPGRRPAHHDGHSRRSHRPPQASAGGSSRLRGRIVACGILHELGDAHRQPRADGSLRGDDCPIDPVAHLHHVPRPEGADHRNRLLDCCVLRGRRHRTGRRRSPPGVLLVGLSVPDWRARDGPTAAYRPADSARVQGSERGSPRPGQRGDVAPCHPRGCLWAQGAGSRRCFDCRARRHPGRGRSRGSFSCAGSSNSSRP